MFQISKLHIHENNLQFIVKPEQETDTFEISFRLRDNERWVLIERNQEFLVKPVKKQGEYAVNVNIDEIWDQFKNTSGKRTVIDLHVLYKSEYKKLTITSEIAELVRSQPAIHLNPLLNVKYYVINNESIGIQLVANNVKPVLRDFKIENDSVTFQVDTLLNNEAAQLNGNKLFVKQRSILSTPQTYSSWEYVSVEDTNNFTLNSPIFTEFVLNEKEIFDLFIEYNFRNYTLQMPLNVGKAAISVKKWCELNGLYSLDLLKGKTGNLSIRTTQKELSLDLEDVFIDQGILNLKIGTKSLVINQPLSWQIRNFLDGIQTKETVVFYEKSIPAVTENDDLFLKIDLTKIFGEFTSNFKRQFKLFIASGYRLYRVTNEDYHDSVSINKTTISCYFTDTLMLETNLNETNPIPIAIMGSCFSRAAFNSADYFNPDYKKYFKVSYSYFWPSIISLVTEPLPFDPENFKDVSENNLYEIEWEFLKNWDKSLHDSGAEYLLVDFFVDAMHGVLQFGPNQFIARNLYTRKTNYYHSTLLKEGKGLECYHPEFFDLWTKCFDQFIERVKGIIPEEKLILNLSNLTDKYYDENHGVSSFFDAKHITRSHFLHVNHVWTKMNNYFLTKLPKAKVIDMNRFNYISRYDSPADLAPCGPHHFESGYYKDIVNELIKVIGVGKFTPKSEALGIR
jgi:hypothetical protein